MNTKMCEKFEFLQSLQLTIHALEWSYECDLFRNGRCPLLLAEILWNVAQYCVALMKRFWPSQTSSQPDLLYTATNTRSYYTSSNESSFDLAFFASNARRLSLRTLFRCSYFDISFSLLYLVVTKSTPFSFTGAIPNRFIVPVEIVFPNH